MHIAVVPILLAEANASETDSRASRNDYEIETTSSPSGVVHVTFTRTAT